MSLPISSLNSAFIAMLLCFTAANANSIVRANTGVRTNIVQAPTTTTVSVAPRIQTCFQANITTLSHFSAALPNPRCAPAPVLGQPQLINGFLQKINYVTFSVNNKPQMMHTMDSAATNCTATDPDADACVNFTPDWPTFGEWYNAPYNYVQGPRGNEIPIPTNYGYKIGPIAIYRAKYKQSCNGSGLEIGDTVNPKDGSRVQDITALVEDAPYDYGTGPGYTIIGWVYLAQDDTQWLQNVPSGLSVSIGIGVLSVGKAVSVTTYRQLPKNLMLDQATMFNALNVYNVITSGAAGITHTMGCFDKAWDGSQ